VGLQHEEIAASTGIYRLTECRTMTEKSCKEQRSSEQGNNSTMRVAKGVRETVNQDGAVLLDIEQGLCFSLNPIGTKIWGMLKEGRSLDEIADALEQEFRLPRTQLLGDISNFLTQLEKARLVGEQSPPAGRRGFLSRLFARNRSA
jgi:Coenzyme PQQ synthesis protein D (PqqD)